MAIQIRILTTLEPAALQRVATGYTSRTKYEVRWEDSPEATRFEVQLGVHSQPYVRGSDFFSLEAIPRYEAMLPGGFCFGALDGEALVGFLIARVEDWNQTLWVWELHVAADHRRQGIGRCLMQTTIEKAAQAGLRVVALETQNTNGDAVQFYRSQGFRLESMDISFYSNTDFPGGEMAFIMKRRLKE
jgi:ribosomal protein S18 acetylase RimI-like enzyme